MEQHTLRLDNRCALHAIVLHPIDGYILRGSAQTMVLQLMWVAATVSRLLLKTSMIRDVSSTAPLRGGKGTNWEGRLALAEQTL